MKKIPVSFASLLTAAVVGALLLLPSHLRADKGQQAVDDLQDDENSMIQVGFAIAPVKLDLRGKNPALVGRGSYIVNAQGGCNDCHSCPTYKPGHSPFPPPLGNNGDGRFNDAGHMAGGVPFALPPPFGTIHSANLTPDEHGNPEGSTFEEFLTTMRTGTDPQNRHRTLVVMPWPTFRFMTDRDLRAVYEYLRAIPPADPGVCFAPGQ